MKKYLLPLVFIFHLSVLSFSCSHYGFFWGQFGEHDVDERSPSLSDFNSEKYLPDLSSQVFPVSEVYSVLIISDLHYGSVREDMDEEVLLEFLDDWFKKYSGAGENPDDKDLTKLPRFALNLGDTADTGRESEFLDYLKYEEKIKALAGKYLYGESENLPVNERKFRIYSILGNHDLYHDGSVHFMKHIFPYKSSYFFTVDADSDKSTGAFSYFFLDTANGTMGADQLEDFRKKLEADSNPKIVLSHYPVWAGGTEPFMFMVLQNTTERNLLLSYFAKNNARQIFEGHAHKFYGHDYNGKFRETAVGSLRYSKKEGSRDKRQCVIFTVDEKNQTVDAEVYKF
ncbi:MAG: metallophosphoesterase [Treponema sp.]|nr:metallophosphoesterase [Treponema sp.]